MRSLVVVLALGGHAMADSAPRGTYILRDKGFYPVQTGPQTTLPSCGKQATDYLLGLGERLTIDVRDEVVIDRESWPDGGEVDGKRYVTRTDLLPGLTVTITFWRRDSPRASAFATVFDDRAGTGRSARRQPVCGDMRFFEGSHRRHRDQ